MNAEGAGFVARRGYNPAFAGAANNQRLSAKLWEVSKL